MVWEGGLTNLKCHTTAKLQAESCYNTERTISHTILTPSLIMNLSYLQVMHLIQIG